MGLREGDLIVRFDDQSMQSLDDLHRVLTEMRIGTTARIGVLRGADRRDIEVRVNERSETTGPANLRPLSLVQAGR